MFYADNSVLLSLWHHVHLHYKLLMNLQKKLNHVQYKENGMYDCVTKMHERSKCDYYVFKYESGFPLWLAM